MKKWLLSYICVLIVPFVFGCMLYGYSQASVQSEVDAIQEMNLRNMQTVVENAVEDARNISEALLCDEKVALLPPAEHIFVKDEHLMVIGLRTDLEKVIKHL